MLKMYRINVNHIRSQSPSAILWSKWFLIYLLFRYMLRCLKINPSKTIQTSFSTVLLYLYIGKCILLHTKMYTLLESLHGSGPVYRFLVVAKKSLVLALHHFALFSPRTIATYTAKNHELTSC